MFFLVVYCESWIYMNKVYCTADGLWADYNDETWPACCSGPQFDKKEVDC